MRISVKAMAAIIAAAVGLGLGPAIDRHPPAKPVAGRDGCYPCVDPNIES